MARTAMLALLVLAGVAACAASPRWIRLGDDEPDKPSCLSFNDEASCLEHECGWCSSEALGGRLQVEGCVAEAIAKLVPESVADCKLPEHPADDDDDDDDDDDVKLLTEGKEQEEQDDQEEQDEQDEQDNQLGRKHHKKHKPEPEPKPEPPATCGDNKEKRDCLKLGAADGECAWCEGDFMPASCMSATAAKFIPEMVAKCKLPKKHKKADKLSEDGPDDPKPKPPTSCGDNKEKHDCLDMGAEEGECAWCEGDFMPASCVGVKAAQWIPQQVAKCKMPKKHKKDDDKDDDDSDSHLHKKKHHKKKLAATCMDIKDDRECVKHGAEEGECAWCGAKFPGLPSTCVEVSKAKFIPEMVATCEMPKDSAGLVLTINAQKGKGGSGYGPSGGAWPSGGGGWPSGGGDYPGPPGGGGAGGQGCMALKSKKECLKGTDTEACAWCGTGSFLGSPCVSESTAKFIPPMVQKCKMGKQKKKHSEAVKLAVA